MVTGRHWVFSKVPGKRQMVATTKDRLDRHDREINGIRTLIRDGMRLMVETRKDLRALAVNLGRLEAAQNKTDKTLRDFIASLRHCGNGYARGTVS